MTGRQVERRQDKCGGQKSIAATLLVCSPGLLTGEVEILSTTTHCFPKGSCRAPSEVYVMARAYVFEVL
jgi:hypothetical protein